MAERKKARTRTGRQAAKVNDMSVRFIRFENPEDFGKFCVLLREADVPFGLRGHHIVAITDDRLYSLPTKPRHFLEACEQSLRVKIEVELSSTGERSLPAEEEVREALKERIAELDALSRKS